MNETLDRGRLAALDKFLYGDYYPVATAAWCFLCFIFNLQTIGLIGLILLACLILINGRDATPIIPLFLSFIIVIRDFSLLLGAPYITAYALFFVCLIYHAIKFPAKNFRLGKLFFPLCLVSAALLLGGVLSTYKIYYFYGLSSMLSVGPLVIIIYLFFLNGIRPPREFDITLFVCKSVIAATVAGCLELLIVFLTKDENFLIYVRDLGWSNFNTLGAMTLIAIPACCYVIVKTGKSACCFAIIALLIVADLLSSSDGSLGIAVFSVPFLVIFTFLLLKNKYRKEFMICLFIALTVLCVAAIAIANKLGMDYILSFAANRAKDNGRARLYAKALEMFRANPLLGVGQGFRDESVYVPVTGSLQTFNFHSTVFHILATMGILGIIAYAFYYFFRIKILLGGNTAFNVFAFLSFVLLEAYGLIDTCEFNVIPLISYATLLILCAELNNGKTTDDGLPLSHYKLIFYA